MANAELMHENVTAVVTTEKKKNRDGEYIAKVVKYKNKSWTIGKKNADKVEVGNEYTFNLERTEYNDSLYYWANPIVDENKPNNSKGSSGLGETDFIKKFVAVFATFPRERQLKAIEHLKTLVQPEEEEKESDDDLPF